MTMHKLSVALLMAAFTALPAAGAYAATPTAPLTLGAKADVPAFATLKPMIGKWTQADITALDSAHAIKVFDTKALYSPADQTMVSTAQTASNADLVKLRAAINADAGLKAWFATNHVDVNRVIGLQNQSGNVSVYLY